MSFSDILQKVNNQRCFVLIGSGPSSEMGYPSWELLAERVVSDLRTRGLLTDETAYAKYLGNRRYPSLFSLAERDYGGRVQLIDAVKKILAPNPGGKSSVYELLSSWPFACYLTTNYDDEIRAHLIRRNQYFQVVQNRPQDFYPIHEGVSNYIITLHGDLDHPDQLVLTADDYDKFEVRSEKRYFRDRLQQILTTFDVLIIGHGLSDPDLDLILRTAKEHASPVHPVYVILPDLTAADISELLNRYNIVALTYSNADGTHSSLRNRLIGLDKFVVHRASTSAHSLPAPAIDEAEIEAATSLFIFRGLNNAGSARSGLALIKPLLLHALGNSGVKGTSAQDLLSNPIIHNIQKVLASSRSYRKPWKRWFETASPKVSETLSFCCPRVDAS